MTWSQISQKIKDYSILRKITKTNQTHIRSQESESNITSNYFSNKNSAEGSIWKSCITNWKYNSNYTHMNNKNKHSVQLLLPSYNNNSIIETTKTKKKKSNTYTIPRKWINLRIQLQLDKTHSPWLHSWWTLIPETWYAISSLVVEK